MDRADQRHRDIAGPVDRIGVGQIVLAEDDDAQSVAARQPIGRVDRRLQQRRRCSAASSSAPSAASAMARATATIRFMTGPRVQDHSPIGLAIVMVNETPMRAPRGRALNRPATLIAHKRCACLRRCRPGVGGWAAMEFEKGGAEASRGEAVDLAALARAIAAPRAAGSSCRRSPARWPRVAGRDRWSARATPASPRSCLRIRRAISPGPTRRRPSRPPISIPKAVQSQAETVTTTELARKAIANLACPAGRIQPARSPPIRWRSSWSLLGRRARRQSARTGWSMRFLPG